ncbi:hypothetical protein RF11_05962 [Thelohanellus kitauei]|uniref:Uncharacterized protein n=1 Tax=Thelohanellus kitauei TaxID=669202 RepID=A0A0C2MCW1_THEKT|nr:hypothetical protein RF11_05962 [Thelohanellus kitauei]
MESCQIIQDFTFNANRIMGPESDEKWISIYWMEKFEESVKFIANLGKGIDHVLRVTSWDIPLSLIINDILSIVHIRPGSCNDWATDLFSQNTATIFMREVFTDLKDSEDWRRGGVRIIMLITCSSLYTNIYDLICVFREDPFLNEILEVWRLTARIYRIKNVFESQIPMSIIDILRTNDVENRDLSYVCIRCIKTAIKEIQFDSYPDVECQYRCFTSLVNDLRRFVDAGIQQNDESLITLIIRLLIRLANKFLSDFIDSINEPDFSFCDELAYIARFENIKA